MTKTFFNQTSRPFAWVLATSACLLFAAGCQTSSPNTTRTRVQHPQQGLKITREEYHGWKDAIRLSNGKAYVVVVPSIGRVMQFGTEGDEGVFWENTFFHGKPQDPRATQWANYGGDKTWPSPEAEWGKYTRNKQWKPPVGFDGLPAHATIEGSDVVLHHPVDPSYGIQATRRIRLDPTATKMTITTTYQRTNREPIKAGIWVITQLKEPERIFVPVPKVNGAYVNLGQKPPPDLKLDNVMVSKVGSGFMMQGGQPLLSLTRNRLDPYKIGIEASSLLWVGPKQMLRIDAPRVPGAEYPDKGSSAEVYTNPDPLQYIELEMLGPLETLTPKIAITQVNTYTLLPRTVPSPEAEARKVFGGQ